MSSLTLFITGMGMGVIHVLTGPDHLSALATLSANVGSLEAFGCGVRWGIGHSIGLVVVGSIFIAIDYSNRRSGSESESGNTFDGNESDGDNHIGIPDRVDSVCQAVVGVFMICLGVYGLVSSHQKYNQHSYRKRENQTQTQNNKSSSVDNYGYGHGYGISESDDTSHNSTSSASASESSSISAGFTADASSELMPRRDRDEEEVPNLNPNDEESILKDTISYGSTDISVSASVSVRPVQTQKHARAQTQAQTQSQSQSQPQSSIVDDIMNHHHHHDFYGDGDEVDCCDCCCCSSCFEGCQISISKPVLSLCIGIVHGVAGPGGVLGVIPAVQLHNWKLAIIYLGTFCVSSTLTMGTFAATYGTCSSYISQSQSQSQRDSAVQGYRMEMFSAGLSLIVGALILYLLWIGKLDEVFP